MLFVTRRELLRVRPAAGEEPLAVPTCPEAQADGVPCDTAHSDCECCGRALAGEDTEPAVPEPPE
jgi:hypothetical protein